MKNSNAVLVSLVVAFAIVGIIFFIQYSMQQKTAPITGNVIDDTLPKTYNIDITSSGFSPNTLQIKAGDTVVWKNDDSKLHIVTTVYSPELSSKNLKPGDEYSHTFAKAGTFKYLCGIYGFKANITVQ